MNEVVIVDPKSGKCVYRKEWPSKWSELTRAQFLRIAPVLYSESNKHAARALVIYKLLRRPIMALRIPEGELFYLADYIRFIVEDRPACSRFFVPKKWVGLLPFLGPSDNFSDMGCWQFASAETLFQIAANKTNDSNALGAFAATLFRPFWQKRFDDAKLAKYGTRLAKLPLPFLQAVFLNYLLVRTSLARQYPTLFREPEEKKSAKKKKDFGWVGIIQKLPGDLFGTLEKRADEPLHNVLTHLEMACIEADEIRAKSQKK